MHKAGPVYSHKNSIFAHGWPCASKVLAAIHSAGGVHSIVLILTSLIIFVSCRMDKKTRPLALMSRGERMLMLSLNRQQQYKCQTLLHRPTSRLSVGQRAQAVRKLKQ